jgi:hypothetical protein
VLGAVADKLGDGIDQVAESIPTMSPMLRRERQAALAPQLGVRSSPRVAHCSTRATARGGREVRPGHQGVRRDPVRIAGLAAGPSVLASGPQRVWRIAQDRIRPGRRARSFRRRSTVCSPGSATTDLKQHGLAGLLGGRRPAGRRGSRIGGSSPDRSSSRSARFGRRLAASSRRSTPTSSSGTSGRCPLRGGACAWRLRRPSGGRRPASAAHGLTQASCAFAAVPSGVRRR